MIIPVLRPESTFRTAWDLITMICICYSLIYVPVDTFFDHEDVKADYLRDLSWGSDSAAMLDILIHSNAAYGRDGVIIEDRRKIVINYLLGSFLIDLISAIPWELFRVYDQAFVYVHCITLIIRLSRLRRMKSLQTQLEKLQYRIDNKLV